MVVRLSALGIGRLYPQKMLLVLISVGGWVDPRALVRSEGFYVNENFMTQSGIEPATFRFLEQRLNHWATAWVPGIFPVCVEGRCVGLTTLRLLRADWLEILEASTCWNPQKLSRAVQELLCLTCPLWTTFIEIFNFCQNFRWSRTGLFYRLLFVRVLKIAKSDC